jgi:hypothetical protein
MLKEHKINKLDNFIKGWYIDKNVCNDLIKLFNLNKDKTKEGTVGYGVKPEIKKSTDLSIHINSPKIEIQNYSKELSKCIKQYIEIYSHLDSHLEQWGIIENFNIQKYKPSEAYFGWHTERNGKKSNTTNRLLVFMTYLNNVKDKGETEWLYQKLKIKPEIGLTIIWPVDWMFIHRGIPSKTEEKFIATGWYSFL